MTLKKRMVQVLLRISTLVFLPKKVIKSFEYAFLFKYDKTAELID